MNSMANTSISRASGRGNKLAFKKLCDTKSSIISITYSTVITIMKLELLAFN